MTLIKFQHMFMVWLLTCMFSCNRITHKEIINHADLIVYSSAEKNEFLKINGLSDTAATLKTIFLNVYELESNDNLSFRDATEINKLVFYFNGKSVTTWVNCLNQTDIVFGIDTHKYVLDSITEFDSVRKISNAIGVELFQD